MTTETQTIDAPNEEAVTAEAPSTEAVYDAPKSKPRAILALGLVAILGLTGGVGATYASLTKTTVQEGHSVTGEATFGMEFLDSSGVITANVSPGATVQDFVISARSRGNLTGQLGYSIDKADTFEFSDAMLDQTVVVVKMNESYGGFQVTLREFLDNAIVSTQLVRGGENFTINLQFRPVTGDAAAAWSAEDLGVFTQAFASSLTLSAVSNGTSDLVQYAEANGELLWEYSDTKKFYSIPAAELQAASENGINGSVTAA